MNKIIAIAANTFKEAIRDKVLFALLFFGFLMLSGSILMGSLTVGDPMKVVIDMGLAGINIFGVLISITVGIGLVYREIDKRTIYTLLTKPVQRWQFIIGKYFGLMLTVGLEVVLLTLLLLTILQFYNHSHTTGILLGAFMIYLELMVVTATAILFSTFSTPFLSGTFTFCIYIIGHVSGDLKDMAENSENAILKPLTKTIYYLIPNLENFNIKNLVPYNIQVEPSFIALAIIHAILYTSTLLFIASSIFQKRDF